ncbi:hypothetical protein ACPWSR_02750 [Alloiococcus sp. CFN-8]|uniref:hypothetical protein n=1 Tax=Alloiococcus sp. CFN-8 TaxID=3416081 RepID=UPI003CF43AE9
MKKSTIPLIITLIFSFILYYSISPALNIHSGELWFIIISTIITFIILYVFLQLLSSFNKKNRANKNTSTELPIKIAFFALGGSLVILLVGILIGIKPFRASTYASLAQGRIEDRNFLNDIKEEEISNIALMDTASAEIIGNRQMGSLSDLVSQFETSDYSTITVNNKPLKASALSYVNFFRYLSNKDIGIPGYIQVNPVSQKAEYIKFEKGLKYVPSAFFSEDLKRHIHSKYPTAIIDSYYFELDEEGKPHYISPYYIYRAGLFGAKDVGGAIIVDPITGDMEKYSLEDIPAWVDRVYDGDLLAKQYDWYGTLKNGYWNSLFAKKGSVVTTDDYGYKSLENDIWVFTGVTSVSSDESNIGFVLMNSRTGAINYYDIYGAEEYSAMSAAEGQVQNLRYKASFPSIINVDGEPVYIMVLKDSGGLTKMYAIVNLQDYSLVATGDTQQEVLDNYKKRLGVSSGDKDSLEHSITITVDSIKFGNIDGNTYAYLISGETAYRLLLKENEEVVLINPGDEVTLLTQDTDVLIKQAILD